MTAHRHSARPAYDSAHGGCGETMPASGARSRPSDRLPPTIGAGADARLGAPTCRGDNPADDEDRPSVDPRRTPTGHVRRPHRTGVSYSCDEMPRTARARDTGGGRPAEGGPVVGVDRCGRDRIGFIDRRRDPVALFGVAHPDGGPRRRPRCRRAGSDPAVRAGGRVGGPVEGEPVGMQAVGSLRDRGVAGTSPAAVVGRPRSAPRRAPVSDGPGRRAAPSPSAARLRPATAPRRESPTSPRGWPVRGRRPAPAAARR